MKMPSGIVLLIVAVVVIIILAYITGVIVRRRNESIIEKLEEQKNTLASLAITDQIEEVKELHLVGQSQTNFREWSQKWTDILESRLPEVENHLLASENLNETFNFVKSKQEMKKATEELSVIEKDIEEIKEALSILKEQEEKNSSRVKHALDLYETLQTAISENEDNYGTTKAEIDKQLKNIETEFNQFVTLNTSGDPIEAAAILDRAEEHTIALGQITEKIPAIVTKLEDDFPDQLDDLETGYRRLLEENYQFADDSVESQLQGIRQAIRDNAEGLVSLDLDQASEENLYIQEKIDNLYGLFEVEIAAQKRVLRASKLIPEYLEHAKTNNKQLSNELERLSRRYILNDAHASNIIDFKKKLTQVEETVLEKIETIENPDKPFSQLQSSFERALETLKAVEEEQVEVAKELQKVERIEVSSRQKVDIYVSKLHAIKRFMEKRNLPGIPNEFLSLFFSTSSRLESLIAELNRNRMAVDTLVRMTEVATSSVDNLEMATYRIIQNAILTEQLLQYSNRYRSFEPGVQDGFAKALYLFEKEYDYQESFTSISRALELVEPGVTDRFVKSYEKTKEVMHF